MNRINLPYLPDEIRKKPQSKAMTATKIDHLRAIEAHLERLLAIAAEQHAAVEAVLKETIHAEPFQLPTPPPGIEWHRKDGWKAGDLPQGYRPVALGEKVITHTTESKCGYAWVVQSGNYTITDCHLTSLIRTTRPLTFTHLGKTWTWHKAGDPCPCDGLKLIEVLCRNNAINSGTAGGFGLTHSADSDSWKGIIGWRYAETEPVTKTVDLGPEDVPPGSVFRCNLCGDEVVWSSGKCWLSVRSVRDNGVELTDDFGWVTWHNLAEDFQINRPANRDADGYPTAWEPCHKQIPAA